MLALQSLAARLTLAAVALAIAGCSDSTAPSKQPSVLLITLDTTRADALGIYGAPRGVSPHLDRLASEGLVFDNAATVCPITLPSHASMLTGLYPPRHTIRDNHRAILPSAATTVAERARAAGVDTGAFLAAVVLDPVFQLDQGFDTYDAPKRRARSDGKGVDMHQERRAPEVVDAALRWFESRDRDRPYLCWVHFYDPHQPNEPLPEFARRFPNDPYRAEVAQMDAAIGRLLSRLESLGELDDTHVIVVGDHGEGMGEHGDLFHGVTCYQPVLQVPFFIRHADGSRAGERSKAVVSVADVNPTIARLLGLGEEEGLDGIDVVAREAGAGQGAYFESYYGWMNYGWSPLAGWMDADGKYMHSSSPELYVLDADPREANNVAAQHPDLTSRYRTLLDQLYAQPVVESEEHDIGAEMRADLQSIGYATSGNADTALPHPLRPSERPSPHASTDELQQVLLAAMRGRMGQRQLAISELEKVIARNPLSLEAHLHLATFLLAENRFSEAAVHCRAMIEGGAAPSWPLASIGVCFENTDEPDRAVEHYKASLQHDPGFLFAMQKLVALLERLGRADEAQPYRVRMQSL